MRVWSALPLLAVLLTPGCIWFSGHDTIQVQSDPMGAEILVDGQPTGLSTPSMVELDEFGGSDHEITLRLDGHHVETRRVVQRSTTEVRRWRDGNDYRVVPLPLWWNLGDFLFPIDLKYTYVPREVFVQLYPDGQAPVGSGPVYRLPETGSAAEADG